MKQKLKQGSLVKISIQGSTYSPEGFVTAPEREGGKILFFERIDLDAYPSSNDFKGNSTLASENDIATVCRFIGRPKKIKEDSVFSHYDVYEIFIQGKIRQAFRQNLVEPEDKAK
tara:strand:- start:755 stop:1099 length:345 start_codon:yes stop_codon:yes gene_type:complete